MASDSSSTAASLAPEVPDLSLFSIPSNVVRDVMCHLLNPSDLLAFRATCVKAMDMLHKESESDEFWKQRLQRDFGFQKKKDDWSRCLAMSERPGNIYGCVPVSEGNFSRQTENEPLSIFGVDPVDAVIVSSSPFKSWKSWCKAKRRFFLKVPVTDDSHLNRTFAEVDAKTFQASYFLRAAEVWKNIFQWCQSPEQSGSTGRRILQNLRKGKMGQDWEGLLRDRPNLQATYAIFAFCGGQNQRSESAGIGMSAFDGLIGGYQAYNYYSCAALVCSPNITNQGLIVGDCFISRQQGVAKRFIVSADTGQLKFLHAQNSVIDVVKTPSSEDILKWLEYHTRRLKNGEIGIGVMGSHPHDPQAVTLYPRFPTGSTPITTEGTQIVSRAVVRGVEIIGSSVFVPQLQHQLGYIYSIRIRLLTPADGYEYQSPEQRGFTTCQLHTRHWKITDDTTGRTNDVAGEGVIGMYPILHEGSYVESRELCRGTFQYQSCSGQMNDGSFSGFIEFVPGSLSQPTGEPFRAEVRPFALISRPEYLY